MDTSLSLDISAARVPCCALACSMAVPGMCRAIVFDGFPALDSLNSSSLSRVLFPPPKRLLRKVGFGGSGSSLADVKRAPIISEMISRNDDEIVNFVSSDGDDIYRP